MRVNPKEADDPDFARQVMEMIPEFLEKPSVLGIGEIGLNKNTKNEIIILEEHIPFFHQLKGSFAIFSAILLSFDPAIPGISAEAVCQVCFASARIRSVTRRF